jgi:hypothetical protein
MQLKARVQFDQPYTHELVKKSLKDCSKFDWIIEENITNDSIDEGDLIHLQWLEYELINWDTLASRPTETLANSYCIRKGLIRKSQMAYNLTKYMSKNPESILKDAIPETWLFELDHIDYLDEAMNEVFEVERDLADNEGRESDRKAFIIKPSMANKAAGIHIFDTMEGLQALFERTRLDSDDQDDDEVERMRMRMRRRKKRRIMMRTTKRTSVKFANGSSSDMCNTHYFYAEIENSMFVLTFWLYPTFKYTSTAICSHFSPSSRSMNMTYPTSWPTSQTPVSRLIKTHLLKVIR